MSAAPNARPSGREHAGALDPSVEILVSDALRIVERTPLPPPPWVEALKRPRARPSEDQHRAYDAHVFPMPEWGLNINLSSSYMGISQGRRIAQMMVTNATVTTLDLSACDLYSEGCEALVACLKRNAVLRHLSLNGNRIGPKGAVALAEYLAFDATAARRGEGLPTCAPVTIAPLGFAGCEEVLPSYVPPHQGFNSVALKGSPAPQPDEAAPLSPTPAHRSPAPPAPLHNNNRSTNTSPPAAGAADGDGPIEWSSRVAGPAPVRRGLYKMLGEYTADDDLAIAPPSYLRCPLESLSIAHNAIGDEGAVAIANALRSNASLRFLNVRGNRLTNLGAFAILDMLADHYTLEADAQRKVVSDREAAKLAKAKGKAKKKSPAARAGTVAASSSPPVPHSCLPRHLRFDMDTLAAEDMMRRAAGEAVPCPHEAASRSAATASAPLFVAASPLTASSPAPLIPVGMPLIYEGLFTLLTSGRPIALVTAADAAAVTAVDTAGSKPTPESTLSPFGTVLAAFAPAKAAAGASGRADLVTEGAEVTHEKVPIEQPAAYQCAALRARERWATLMSTEQRQEFLAFNFPALFPQQHSAGSPPNPILSDAARILFDGNSTLNSSLLAPSSPSPTSALFSQPAASSSSPRAPAAPRLAPRPPASQPATNNAAPEGAVPIYVQRRHVPPTAVENAGGYFYPTVVPCAGRPATLTAPAMTVAPEEIAYFVDASGRPYTLAFTERTAALRPSSLFSGAATVVAATALQFIQASLVRAMGYNVALAAPPAASAPTANAADADDNAQTLAAPPSPAPFAEDPHAVSEAARAGAVESQRVAAAAAAADDYHNGSPFAAIFGRADRAVGERGAPLPVPSAVRVGGPRASLAASSTRTAGPFAPFLEGTSGVGAAVGGLSDADMASIDPFPADGAEAATTARSDATAEVADSPPREGSRYYRYADHLPVVGAAPNAATSLPIALRPAAPSAPLSPPATQQRPRRSARPAPFLARSPTDVQPLHSIAGEQQQQQQPLVAGDAPLPSPSVAATPHPSHISSHLAMPLDASETPHSLALATALVSASNVSLTGGMLLVPDRSPPPAGLSLAASASTVYPPLSTPAANTVVVPPSAAAAAPPSAAVRKRFGTADQDTIVPSVFGRPSAPSAAAAEAAWRRSLLPAELRFLEAMGYFGGRGRLERTLAFHASRQHIGMGGGQDAADDADGWRIGNPMAPHFGGGSGALLRDEGAARGADGGIGRQASALTSAATDATAIPPFGQLAVPTFCLSPAAAEGLSYRHLLEYRSAGHSPAGDEESDGSDTDGDRNGTRRRKGFGGGAREVIALGGLLPTDESAAEEKVRPFGPSSQPLSLLGERLRSLLASGSSGNQKGERGGRAAKPFGAAAFGTALDQEAAEIAERARDAALLMFDGWTRTASAVTASVEVSSHVAASLSANAAARLAATAGHEGETVARRGGALARPIAPPTPAERQTEENSGLHTYAPDGSGCAQPTNASIGNAPRPSRPANAIGAPLLPPRLPLPSVSLEDVARAAKASLFGSAAVADAALSWRGGRKDIKEEGTAVADMGTLASLSLLPKAASPAAPRPPAQITGANSHSPESHQRPVAFAMPAEAVPFVP